MPQWFLGKTIPKSELRARDSLERLGLTVYLPMTKVDRRKRPTAPTEAMEPLFPSYIAIQLELGVHDVHQIKNCRGMSNTGIVRFGEELARFPPGTIELMMQNDGIAPQHEYKPGDEIYVRTGPFADLRATVKNQSSKDRVKTLMEIMGDYREITFHLTEVEPA